MQQLILERLNEMGKNTIMEVIDLQFIEISEDQQTIKASIPVTHKVHQPYGLLHGGASAVLAETAGSVLSAINVDAEKYIAVGTQINMHHLRSVKDGVVIATANFIKKGKSSHLIKIEIHDKNQKLISYGHLNTAILPKGSK